VITLGEGWNRFVLEGSAFHGAEPDEERWDLDGGAINSYSGRLKIKLGTSWSAQVSNGYLHDPEALEPGDVHRTTVSLETGADGTRDWAATLVWGQNNEEHGIISNSLLAEAAWQKTRLDQLYGRFEWVEKNEELLATKALSGDTSLADIYTLTGGYMRNIDLLKQVTTGLGGDVTVYDYPESLKDVYGDFPVSFHVFLRARWGD
jgi:hypothetical protein